MQGALYCLKQICFLKKIVTTTYNPMRRINHSKEEVEVQSKPVVPMHVTEGTCVIRYSKNTADNSDLISLTIPSSLSSNGT